jgi:hypothetical protein
MPPPFVMIHLKSSQISNDYRTTTYASTQLKQTMIETHFADHHSMDTEFLNVPTRLNNIQTPTRLAPPKATALPVGYIPSSLDICCGRGKKNWNYEGNVTFRNIVQANVSRYIDAPTKSDKTSVVVGIVDDIRSLGGRFLKEDDSGNWYDIGDAQAREKVGHSLRDQVSSQGRQPISKVAMKAARNQIADRRPSNAQSDGGNETEMRRATLSSSLILEAFTRRPSFLSSLRSSALQSVVDSAPVDGSRRYSAWEFLKSLNEIEINALDDGEESLSDDTPLDAFGEDYVTATEYEMGNVWDKMYEV